MTIGGIIAVATLAAVALGCDTQSTPATLGAKPAARAENPLTTGSTPGREELHFSGRVREALRAGAYTYLLVEAENGARWVVTLGAGAPVDHDVDVVGVVARDGFHSKRLQRSFDRVLFAVVTSGGAS